MESKARLVKNELKSELGRKAIHLLVALVPCIAALDFMGKTNTALLLIAGLLFYACVESMRFLGIPLPFFSSLTKAVEREKEQGRFVIAPVTLGLGALFALILFPLDIAKAAIYALAFGDSAASLTGKCFGRIRPAFLKGKSVEGSLACFAVSALAGFLVFHDWKIASAMGAVSMVVDTLPVEDFDNLLLPLASGLTASLVSKL